MNYTPLVCKQCGADVGVTEQFGGFQSGVYCNEWCLRAAKVADRLAPQQDPQ